VKPSFSRGFRLNEWLSAVECSTAEKKEATGEKRHKATEKGAHR
jgi:hypothetical protein